MIRPPGLAVVLAAAALAVLTVAHWSYAGRYDCNQSNPRMHWGHTPDNASSTKPEVFVGYVVDT